MLTCTPGSQSGANTTTARREPLHVAQAAAQPARLGRGRWRKRVKEAFYEPEICVDVFEPDSDRLIRVRRYEVEETYDIGKIVPIDNSEFMGFARVVSYEGDDATGFVCLQELHGREAEKAAEDLAVPYDDWCEPVED